MVSIIYTKQPTPKRWLFAVSYNCRLRLAQEAHQHGCSLRTGRATGRIKAGAGLAGNEPFGHRPLYRLFCPSLHRATVLISVQVAAGPDIAALITQIQQYPELGKILSDVLAKQASTDENTENGNSNLSDSE